MVYGFTHADIMAEYVENATQLVYKTSWTLEEDETLTESEFYKLDDMLFKALVHFEWYTEQDVEDYEVRAEYEELEALCYQLVGD